MDLLILKKQNTKLLYQEGILVIEHLPHLEVPKFRAPAVVAKRVLALLALFHLHLGYPKETVQQWIQEHQLGEVITSRENLYLQTDFEHLSEQDQIDIYWLIEAIWSFAWIGGLHGHLSLNTGVEDSLVDLLPNLSEEESVKEFIATFSLRSPEELLTCLDYFYRAHWFARRYNNQSEAVDLDIIIERRKALEYTCYKNLSWDSISLDT